MFVPFDTQGLSLKAAFFESKRRKKSKYSSYNIIFWNMFSLDIFAAHIF